jgi:hypothetical protein
MGGLCPDKGLGVGVVVLDMVVDGGGEVGHTFEDTATNTLGGSLRPFFIGEPGYVRSGLDLAFLVNTKHQGVFRSVEVKADDFFQLLNEMRIVREFECFDQVRL